MLSPFIYHYLYFSFTILLQRLIITVIITALNKLPVSLNLPATQFKKTYLQNGIIDYVSGSN